MDIPLHLVYRATPNISFKAGPVISIPVKEAFGNSILNYGKAAYKDTVYHTKLTDQAKTTKYIQTINFGVSGGISLQYQRFLLEATYLKSFKPQTVSSDLGSYNFNYNTLQFTIGFKFNKPK